MSLPEIVDAEEVDRNDGEKGCYFSLDGQQRSDW